MALEELLENNDGTKAMVDRCIEIVCNSNGCLIFGAGVGGVILYNILNDYDVTEKLVGFSDNNTLKHGMSYCEERLIVVKPEDIINKFGNDITIIVASSAYDHIKEQLIKLGVDGERIYLFNFAFMDVKYTDYEFISDHIKDYNRAFIKLFDEKSRKIFTSILNYRITKDEEYLVKMQKYVDNEYYQYFDKELFELSKDEVLLDVGAYTGDTFSVFNKVYKEWQGYIGIEADLDVFEELKKTIDKASAMKKVQLYNVAAWDECTTLLISTNPGASSVMSTEDGVRVKAINIDELLLNNKVSLIKMDIEGAEYRALCGMKNLIRDNKPILAICVYHSRDGFYKITDLIEEILPNEYKYFFRQYRFTPTETVCYAIPRRRLKNK